MKTTDLRSGDVYVAHAPGPVYGLCELPAMPELPSDVRRTTALAALRRVLADAALDVARFGTRDWNPLGDVIQTGQKVVLKPNWVSHRNHAGQGLDCLVTHPDVIEAVLHYVIKTQPGSILVGDAPLQGCDFEALLRATGLRHVAQQFRAQGAEVALRDFRRVILPGGTIHRAKQNGCRGLDEYVLFDLGAESLLEPITETNSPFRVTMYDPQALHRTHGPCRHQYLVAREVIEADVVINLPKLKTHKKAGLTGALKNMVGMNGHKEYLPHHRRGNPETQGDCYETPSRLKARAEAWLDSANGSTSAAARYLFSRAASLMLWCNRRNGGDGDVEGSWHGNDTVWRTCLDLQRILHYGQLAGELAPIPQRRVLNITDAIVAGQGEGPLAPEPVPLGVITLGASPAAVEWVHALLMRLDPRAIPIVRESFSATRHPLAGGPPESIRVHVDGQVMPLEELAERYGRTVRPPRGWRGHCELARS